MGNSRSYQRIGVIMFSEIKREVLFWASDVNRIIRDEFVDLEPHEYCIGATLVIAIGFVLLRR